MSRSLSSVCEADPQLLIRGNLRYKELQLVLFKTLTGVVAVMVYNSNESLGF